jgi:AcrR family transcriptional regulator
MAEPERRAYASPRRQEQARETRRRIVDAAHAAFLERGYAGATLDEIATAAGVSLQTLYNSVGGKPALLKAAYDVALAGDDEPIPVGDRPRAQAMLAATDGREAMAHYAALGRELGDRAGPLLAMVQSQAVGGDPDLQAFAETTEAERAIGTANAASFVAEGGGRRAGRSTKAAADVLWTLTSPEVRHRLVVTRGWSADRFERWLAQAMGDALLGPDA